MTLGLVGGFSAFCYVISVHKSRLNKRTKITGSQRKIARLAGSSLW